MHRTVSRAAGAVLHNDVFRAYTTSNNVWRVALENGSGVSFDDEPLAVLGPDVIPQPPTDVNSDGRAEVFITVGGGNTAQLGLYTLIGCALTRVHDSGQPAVFSSGATTTRLEGVKCTDHNGDGTTDILQYRGMSTNGITYTVETTVFTLVPAGFLAPSLAPPSFQTTNPGQYSGFLCNNLNGVQFSG